MNEQRRKVSNGDQDLVEGDGTKSHDLHGKKNEINVILGKDLKTGEKRLLALGVNANWKKTSEQFVGKAYFAVSDNESSLRNALVNKASNYQACVNHAVTDVLFYLWSAGLPKEERKQVTSRVVAVLETLRNSVVKHLGGFGF
ncbi:MAG: hypothetical protein ACFFDI_11410 [Promethearchaeota archaeon]